MKNDELYESIKWPIQGDAERYRRLPTAIRAEIDARIADWDAEFSAKVVALADARLLEAIQSLKLDPPPQTGEPSTVPRGHCNRCDRCGWALGRLFKTWTCTVGNCTQRPLPDLRTHCAGCGAPYETAPGATSALLETLRKGRERVARGWTQGEFARDQYGCPASMGGEDAVCWCVRGATGDSVEALLILFHILFPTEDEWKMFVPGRLVRWNDAPERTQADVVALFDSAIAAEQEKESRP